MNDGCSGIRQQRHRPVSGRWRQRPARLDLPDLHYSPAHLLDTSQPSSDEMRADLSEKVRAPKPVAEGFYALWLKQAGL